MIKPYELKDPIKIKEKISKTTDLLGHPIDKGILRSVVILNSLGFITSASCEGHEEEYNSNPFIDIIFQTDPSENVEECKKLFFETLYKDLEEFYKNREIAHDNKISFRTHTFNQFEIRLYINTNLKVYGETREKMVKNHYLELVEFCEYLNKKYHLNY